MTTLSLGQPGAHSEKDFGQSFSTKAERWRAVWGLELYSRNGLPASERAQATNNLTPWGGSDYRTPYGNPGSILDSNGQLWGIPPAQYGTHLSAADLLPGGNYYDRYTGAWLLPQQRRINGLVSGSYDVSDDTEIIFNALLNDRWTKTHHAALGTPLIVPNSNPFYVNPVAGNTNPVQVLYGCGADLGDIVERGTVRSGQLALGLKHHLNAYWDLEATGGYTYEKQLDRQSNLVNLGVLQSYLTGLDLTGPDPTTAFNPFGAGSTPSWQTSVRAPCSWASRVNARALKSEPLWTCVCAVPKPSRRMALISRARTAGRRTSAT